MEDQTRFDLNRALIAWKEELAAQPGLAAADIRELEAHVLECFGAGRRSGLSEQEAFERAIRQLGSSHEIGAEFEKLHPLRSWRARVFLMALAGLIMWAWSGAGNLLALLGPVVLDLQSPWWMVLPVMLNGVVPVAILFLLANGHACGLLSGSMRVFGSRGAILAATIACGLILNYASALAIWHHPNPGTIFGPGEREMLSANTLFWRSCSQFPVWPGPLLVLLIWLCHDGRRLLSTLADRNSPHSLRRQTVFWIALGGFIVSVFGWLGIAVSMLWSKLAFALFPPSEETYRVIHSSRSWLTGTALLLVAVFAARGQLGSIAERLSGRLDSRKRIAMAGALALLVVVSSEWIIVGPSPWSARLLSLLVFGCWPALLLCFVVWLAPLPNRAAKN